MAINVYVVGTSCTTFGKHADKSFNDLVRMAYLDVLDDCGMGAGSGAGALIEQAWFGNCGFWQFYFGCNIALAICF